MKQVEDWFEIFFRQKIKSSFLSEGWELIICPSFVHLQLVKQLIDKYQMPIKLGAQDISPYPLGSYTGEVAGRQLADICEYVIIGHSERREYFHEDDRLLRHKVDQALEDKLKVVYCIGDKKTTIPPGVDIVAYEPVWAIGSGKAESSQEADRVAGYVKKNSKIETVIYGGSVNPKNIRQFFQAKYIDGVLPGKASLEPSQFYQMIIHAQIEA